MSFDSDPRDEVSAEEHYGEMEIKELRELTAELVECAHAIIQTFDAIQGTRDARLALSDLIAVVAKAEKLK